MARKKKKNKHNLVAVLLFLILVSSSICYVYKLEKKTVSDNKIGSSTNKQNNVNKNENEIKIEFKDENKNDINNSIEESINNSPSHLSCMSTNNNTNIVIDAQFKNGTIIKLSQKVTNTYNSIADAKIYYQGMQGEISEGMYHNKDGLTATTTLNDNTVILNITYDYKFDNIETPLGSIKMYDDVKNYYINSNYSCN